MPYFMTNILYNVNKNLLDDTKLCVPCTMTLPYSQETKLPDDLLQWPSSGFDLRSNT